MRGIDQKGSAIILSIFFTFVVFTLTTVLFARARQNQLYTQQLAHRTQQHYLAKAAVNQFMVDLGEDAELIERGPDQPITGTWDGYSGKVWVEPDPDVPGVFHVIGHCYPAGRPDLAESFTRVVRKQEKVESAVFASIPTFDKPDVPDSLMVKKSSGEDWESIPPPPLMVVGKDGTIQVDESRYAGNFRSLSTSPDGLVYGKYTPLIESKGLIGIMLRKYAADSRKDPSGRTANQVFELNKILDSYGGLLSGQDGAVMRYDGETETWEGLPAIPDRYYDKSGNLVDTGELGWPGMLGSMKVTENAIYASGLRKGNDSLLKFDLKTNEWETLPPAPKAIYDLSGNLVVKSGIHETPWSVVTDAEGQLYSSWSSGEGTTGFKYHEDSKTWEALPPIPNGFYDQNDQYVVDNTVRPKKWGIVDAGPEGELYAVNFATLERSDASADSVFVFKDGTWSTLPPPKEQSISIDGEVTGSDQRERIVNMISTDKDGSLTAHYRRPNDYDRIYQRKAGGYEVLPRIPHVSYNSTGEAVQDGYEEYVEMGIGGAMKNVGGGGYVSTASF